MKWFPVPIPQTHLRYCDPVLTVSTNGRTHVSQTAQEVLGYPDDILLLKNDKNEYAVRAVSANCKEFDRHARALDPSGLMRLGRDIPRGHYVLLGGGPIFPLEARRADELKRHVKRFPR